MFIDAAGPIQEYSFGRFVVNGTEHSEDELHKTGVGKDICLTSEGITGWRERKGHLLKPKMLAPALAFMPALLIIGSGAQGLLECPPGVLDNLADKGIAQVEVLTTDMACARYNRAIRAGIRVMLLAHGTC